MITTLQYFKICWGWLIKLITKKTHRKTTSKTFHTLFERW